MTSKHAILQLRFVSAVLKSERSRGRTPRGLFELASSLTDDAMQALDASDDASDALAQARLELGFIAPPGNTVQTGATAESLPSIGS
jgi:hypothetical protein